VPGARSAGTVLTLVALFAVSRITGARQLGLTQGRVRVADSNPGWQSAFGQIAAELRTALAGLEVTVEHVGSTAVPGLAAKPIIDIAIDVRGDLQIDRVIRRLEPLGYIYRGDGGDGGGHLFVLDDQPDHPIAHIHVVSTDDPRWSRYLAFRDRLREDAAARAEYEHLKRQLADQFPNDRGAYTAAKESFIHGLFTRPGSSSAPSSSIGADPL
jgi:GrpB-like predicted nucleotidyltransferase (UPF0157 family)